MELCDNLLEGGTTPGAGTIALARAHLSIKLYVMIRPRGGDFCYSPLEFDIMKEDVKTAVSLGADGIVAGILMPDGTIDRERMSILRDLAGDCGFTCHRAFDMTADKHRALDDLISLGIERVLTSGQQSPRRAGTHQGNGAQSRRRHHHHAGQRGERGHGAGASKIYRRQ